MMLAIPQRAAATGAARLRSALPRGPRDLVRQIVIVSLFDIAYELSRVLATGGRGTALAHARSVVGAERSLGIFHELSVQRFALDAPGIVMDVANWTYFNAQFTVTFLFLLWAYLRHTDRYWTIRNTVIAADAIGLIGYLTYPTAPPRMFPRLGFTDTLNGAAVNHHSGAIASLANPYAAMPSLHTAYALIFGVSGVALARRWWVRGIWALYPGLVVFSIVATANHFILDAVAGAAVALVAGTITTAVLPHRTRSGRKRPASLTPERACS
ncbi:MAG TPA: phosphatase PAP2 family protein [Gaiellales bacterium]|nr:phosphatase PAP2 family protein [Gaiellales bacterium]